MVTLDTQLKDPTFLCWAKRGPQLAVGDSRGNVLLYNKDTRRKVPVVGKHSSAIISGAWSAGGLLALGSDDHVLTISDGSGKTLETTELQQVPTQLDFMKQKFDGPPGSRDDSTVTVNMDGTGVLLYDLAQSHEPIELGFERK